MRSVGWRGTGWNNPKPAPGALGLVQDFVNTRNYLQGGDLLGGVEEADRRLAERGLLEDGESVGEAGRRVLVDFREALRVLLLAHNGAAEPGPGVEGLNEFAASAALGVRSGRTGAPPWGPWPGTVRPSASWPGCSLRSSARRPRADGGGSRLAGIRRAAGSSMMPPRTAWGAGATCRSAGPGTRCAATASASSRRADSQPLSQAPCILSYDIRHVEHTRFFTTGRGDAPIHSSLQAIRTEWLES